ncbi:hypothetical protein [Sorangium sp. So ce861]|uniref:hypothetical protein n=1 Tax=Sorangium sp. So ce861 TaxID=3133323 RepID=UPI003F62FDC6
MGNVSIGITDNSFSIPTTQVYKGDTITFYLQNRTANAQVTWDSGLFVGQGPLTVQSGSSISAAVVASAGSYQICATREQVGGPITGTIKVGSGDDGSKGQPPR